MVDRDFISALDGAREIDLTATGRRSGREITTPVWFVREDHSVYVVPIYGADTNWYKNVLQTPTVRIATDGYAFSASTRPITDQARIAEIVDAFRAKYGAANVDAYYPTQDVAVEVPLD
jgi:deazaflavin-dependent oxidoreductase (nitroreductase family)